VSTPKQCKLLEIDLAKTLGASSCLGILGTFAADLIRNTIENTEGFTLYCINLSSAQVLDYRFVYYALTPLLTELNVPTRTYNLVVKVRNGPQLRNLQLGLAWPKPKAPHPTIDDVSAAVAGTGRFVVAQIADDASVQYLGASSTDLELLSQLADGPKTAVQLQAALHRSVEEVVEGLENLVNKRFVRMYSCDEAHNSYASISYLLTIAEREVSNGH
jgi:hypothetical protein